MNPRKLLIRTAGLVNHRLSETHWCLFFTLTYRDGAKWEPSQVTNFIENYRIFIKRNGCPDEKLIYMWTTEKNKDRDYIHYHGLMWIPNSIKPKKLGKPDEKGWWKHGDTNVQKSHSPAGYIAKYITKSEHEFPTGLRRYAIQVKALLCIDYLKIPSWLCFFSKYGDRLLRLKGAGWYNQTTNKAYQSPYYFDSSKKLQCRDGVSQYEEWHVAEKLLLQTGFPF